MEIRLSTWCVGSQQESIHHTYFHGMPDMPCGWLVLLQAPELLLRGLPPEDSLSVPWDGLLAPPVKWPKPTGFSIGETVMGSFWRTDFGSLLLSAMKLPTTTCIFDHKMENQCQMKSYKTGHSNQKPAKFSVEKPKKRSWVFLSLVTIEVAELKEIFPIQSSCGK